MTQIQDFNKNLKDNLRKEDYEYILSEIKAAGCEKRKIFQLIFLEQYKDLRTEVLTKLANYPVLRSRLCLLSSMNTTKKLNAMICAYVQRVKWHIYRMYRTRNAIVHSGEVPRNLKYLGEHLHSYLGSVVQTLRLQPILKGLPGDADHVADTDRLEQSGVGEFIGRAAADTENGCDVIHGVSPALRRPFVSAPNKHVET